MIFNSVTYLVFLSLVVSLFWLLPGRSRLILIFLSSLTFYAFWRPEFIFLILFSALVDFFLAKRIYKEKIKIRKKLFLILAITINLSLLFYFKYLLFVIDNAVFVLNFLGNEISSPLLQIILPLGISFYTFQTISYTADVYRGVIKPERDFILYGCYVTFFPQLIAGPILRAGEVMHQILAKPRFRIKDINSGIRRILYGLFLKVVLADNIAPMVDQAFAMQPENLSAIDVVTIAFLFGFQIYFDFSAYSHIAIGSALLMGIKFPENFNFPYMSTSIREFWQKWHISLSSWIRDYLYLPLLGVKFQTESLGGLARATDKNQNKRNGTFILFLTWAIMGLWHGSNWTFIFWGLYHAFFIFLYRIFSAYFVNNNSFIFKLSSWIITLIISMLGWIPFRAESLNDTLLLYSKLFMPSEYLYLGMRENIYIVTFVMLVFFVITYYIFNYGNKLLQDNKVLVFISQSIFLSFLLILVFVFLRPINQFIYFQF